MTLENNPETEKKSFLRIKRAALFLAPLCLVLAMVLVFANDSGSQPEFVWLKEWPKGRSSIVSKIVLAPGRMPIFGSTAGKYNLDISCQIVGTTGDFLNLVRGLQAPCYTNDNGMIAWRMSPGKNLEVMKLIATSTNIGKVSSPEMTLANDMTGQLGTGPVGTNNLDVYIKFKGNISQDKIILLEQFSAPKHNTPAANGSTSGIVATSSLIENQGSLVLWLGKNESELLSSQTRNLFLIIKPTVIDSKGNPVKFK